MSSIKQRPNGSWRARYRDEAGKEHARHFPLKRDAQRWLDEVTTAVVTGQYADPRAGRVTFSAWATAWINRQVWADGTVDKARLAISTVPWKDRAIGSVRTSEVQAWVAGESRRGLAPTTVAIRLKVIGQVFRAAVADKVIASSPAVGVKGPRVPRTDASMRLLTVDQVGKALDVAPPEFRAFVAVCVFAGLRLGEAAALQVGDIDFLRRTVAVNRQAQGTSAGNLKISAPKYGNKRSVPVADVLLGILSQHIAVHSIRGAESYLFRTATGDLYGRTSASKAWSKIRDAAGIESATLHTLRHTFASALIAAGCDVVKVQRSLGHSRASITLDVYSHLWPSSDHATRSALGAFESAVAGSADSSRTAGRKAQVRG